MRPQRLFSFGLIMPALLVTHVVALAQPQSAPAAPLQKPVDEKPRQGVGTTAPYRVYFRMMQPEAGLNGKTVICASDDALCDGSPNPYDRNPYGAEGITYMSYAGSLERVEIYGRRGLGTDHTVCVGSECRQYLADLSETVQRAASDNNRFSKSLKDAIADVAGIVKDASACDSVAAAAGNEQVRNTTSHDTDENRQLSVSTNISVSRLHHNMNFGSLSVLGLIAYTLNSGYDINYTYSDGGTEQLKYVIGPSIAANLRIKPGTLKKGDGVSKCPKQ